MIHAGIHVSSKPCNQRIRPGFTYLLLIDPPIAIPFRHKHDSLTIRRPPYRVRHIFRQCKALGSSYTLIDWIVISHKDRYLLGLSHERHLPRICRRGKSKNAKTGPVGDLSWFLLWCTYATLNSYLKKVRRTISARLSLGVNHSSVGQPNERLLSY